MSLKTVTVTVDVLPAVISLATGYLQPYACLDQENKESCEFEANSSPTSVNFKDSPARVNQISKILADNGLLGAASIPIPSMSDVRLDKVGRSNIKKSTSQIQQESLDNYDINPNLELLCPLREETIESFRDELSDLRDSRADSLIIYPLLLINNCESNENIVGEDQLIGANEQQCSSYSVRNGPDVPPAGPLGKGPRNRLCARARNCIEEPGPTISEVMRRE